MPIPNATATSNSVNALILLFVFDKMDIPLTENTIAEMVCSLNNWINYMDYKQALNTLIEKDWIEPTAQHTDGDAYYTLTVDGRVCLSHLFFNIPSHTRAEIVEFVNTNRMHYRRKQEYCADYMPNDDGTYTVLLRITDTTKQILEVSMCVTDRQTAAEIYHKWEDKAADVYGLLYEQLLL